MPTPPRFGLLTTNMAKLRKARELAALAGYVIDLYPLDAPPPEPGTFEGLIAEVAANAPHDLARRMFLEHLTRLAKVIPVVVFDQTLNYKETNALRAAGIKWYGVLKDTAFAALIAHPLAAKATVPPEGDAGPDSAGVTAPLKEPNPEDSGRIAIEITSTVG